jgi:hypothetical protein
MGYGDICSCANILHFIGEHVASIFSFQKFCPEDGDNISSETLLLPIRIHGVTSQKIAS